MAEQGHRQVERSVADYDVTARYYDTIYDAEQVPDDQGFYQELAASQPGPVLELGCGTGRVTLPLARAGHQVTGLDLSRSMLSILRDKLGAEPEEVRRRVTLVEGDMADIDLPERFGLILTPFRCFQHLLEPMRQRRCLELVARHLRPDGRFVLNAFNPNLTYIADAMRVSGIWKQVNERTMADGGGTLRRYVQLTPRPGRQQHELLWKYEVCDRTGRVQEVRIEEMQLRWIYRWEAEYLLELSGLEVEAAYGAFDKRPLDEQAGELIFVCRRRDRAAAH